MKAFLFLLVFFSTFVFSQIPFPGRGVNLGNWLDAPKFSLEGRSPWGTEITAADFANIGQKGFDHIRIPMRFSEYLTADNRVSPEFMAKAKWAVEQTIANGMIAIIDVHHFDSIIANPHAHFPALKNIWEDISLAFKDYPDSLVLFELLNEPNDKLTIELWNIFPAQLIEIIRRTNPTRPILLGTADWGGFGSLKALKIPDDEHLIITLHYYSPHQFTHQGASWNEGSAAWRGTRWTGTLAQKLAMKSDFQEVADYAKANNLNIHIGEFGAYSDGGRTNYNDRVLWTKYVAELCNHFGFSFAYWEYSSGFGLFDPVAQRWHEELTAALFSEEKIDDIELPLGENLVRNPNFADGRLHWTSGVWQQETGAAEFNFNNPDGLEVNVSKTPNDFWGIQVIQNNLPLEAGKSYMISFDISGDDAMIVSLGVSTATSHNYWGSVQARVPERSVSTIIAAKETDESLNLLFSFGFTTGKAVISNVSVREIIIDDNTSISTEQPSARRNSARNQRVFVSRNVINAAPFSEFDIISANGRILYSGKTNSHGKAEIRNLPRGVYTIRVRNVVAVRYLQK